MLAACAGNDGAPARSEGALASGPFHVGVYLYTVEPGFTVSSLTSEIAHANSVWGPADIQFDFDPTTDVQAVGPATCADGDVKPFGAQVIGKIPIFYCPSRHGGDSNGVDNYIRWTAGNDLAHELGHYFHLNHIFPSNIDPEDADVIPGSGRLSVETYIRQNVEAQCPGCSTLSNTLIQSGFTFLNALMNADGLLDTGFSWEAPPARAGNECSPSYYVSIRTHFSTGQVFDYGFHPVQNNMMGYFQGCMTANPATPTIPAIPEVLTSSQIQIVRHALLQGNRADLVPNPLVTWNGAFSDANGWSLPQYGSTIRFPDIDNNGSQDICGRGGGGIWCGVSSGGTFSGPTLWNSSYSDYYGWDQPQYYTTIGFPELNGTGGRDVCGRGAGGIWCGLNNGWSFSGPTLWTGSFADAGGWDQLVNYSTLRYPDVDGDHKSDVCGRHTVGVYCATSTGTSFNPATLWSSDLNDPSFNQPQYYGTVRFPNVNGIEAGNVERADLCARGMAGVYCAISNGSSFTGFSLWTTDFSDAEGFAAPEYYETIGYPDLNRDRKADICARGISGVYCALSNGSSFGPLQLWTTGFSDAAGFSAPQYYKTMSFPDLDHDGQSDICARGPEGMYCANSNGATFVDYRLYTTAVAGGTEWDSPADYATLSFQNVDGDIAAELCGRSSSGIVCEQP